MYYYPPFHIRIYISKRVLRVTAHHAHLEGEKGITKLIRFSIIFVTVFLIFKISYMFLSFSNTTF